MPLDLKVIAGVFATLLGVAVAMSAGDVDFSEIKLPSLSLDGLKDFKDLFETESKNGTIRVSGSLSSDEAIPWSFRFSKQSRVEIEYVSGGEPLRIGGISLGAENETEISVVLEGFSGTIEVAGDTDIDGRADRILVGDLILQKNGTQITAEDLDPSRLRINSVSLDLSIEGATGDLSVQTKSTQSLGLVDEDAEISDYRGSLEIMFSKNFTRVYTLDGFSSRIEVMGDTKTVIEQQESEGQEA